MSEINTYMIWAITDLWRNFYVIDFIFNIYFQEILAVFDARVDYSPLYEPLSELISENSLSSLLLSQALSLLNKLGESI